MQNGSYNVWGNTFSGISGLTGIYYDPWPLDWTASLLGQLDQIPLFNQLNFYFSSGWQGPSVAGWDPQNTTVLSTQLGDLALSVGGQENHGHWAGNSQELRGQFRWAGQFHGVERRAGAAERQSAAQLCRCLLE